MRTHRLDTKITDLNVTYTHHTDASTLYSDEGRGQLR